MRVKKVPIQLKKLFRMLFIDKIFNNGEGRIGGKGSMKR
jgi:hypothetical protein